MSLREISKQTGIPKTTVKETLNAHGLSLRNYASGQIPSSKRATVQKPGRPPYGYGYIDGQLAIDPRENSIVKQILNLWRSGKSFNAIAIHLNGKKTPSRNQTQWTRSVVRRIALCHESKNAKPERK
jgi:site-specific DNA recombinase